MKKEMFKKLQDFIDDIKGQDGDAPPIEGVNDQEKVPSDKSTKNFFENFFQLQGVLPDNDDDEHI